MNTVLRAFVAVASFFMASADVRAQAQDGSIVHVDASNFLGAKLSPRLSLGLNGGVAWGANGVDWQPAVSMRAGVALKSLSIYADLSIGLGLMLDSESRGYGLHNMINLDLSSFISCKHCSIEMADGRLFMFGLLIGGSVVDWRSASTVHTSYFTSPSIVIAF
jgi:hypothetical protein